MSTPADLNCNLSKNVGPNALKMILVFYVVICKNEMSFTSIQLLKKQVPQNKKNRFLLIIANIRFFF